MSKTRKTSRTPTKPTNVPEIPKEFQETTMQMPIGVGSLFWAVECRVLTPAEGMTIAFSTAHSNWNTGKTHAKSYNQIAIALQISQAYVKQLIKRVSDWMRSVKQTTKGKIYQLVSHVIPEDTPEDQFPYDENGRPLKFAVPIGDGSPFDRLCQGHISWQACWLWLIMKRNSNWKPGENGGVTFSLSYKTLSKHSGLGTATIQRAIKQLKTAGMLKRLSLPHEAGIYQLYPKPAPRPVKRTNKPVRLTRRACRDGRIPTITASTSNIASKSRPGSSTSNAGSSGNPQTATKSPHTFASISKRIKRQPHFSRNQALPIVPPTLPMTPPALPIVPLTVSSHRRNPVGQWVSESVPTRNGIVLTNF